MALLHARSANSDFQSDEVLVFLGASEVVLWISLIAESSLSQHLVLLLD